MPVHDPNDIEGAVRALKAKPVAGLIVMPDTFTTVNRRRIIALAARERLPVVYANGAAVSTRRSDRLWRRQREDPCVAPHHTCVRHPARRGAR